MIKTRPRLLHVIYFSVLLSAMHPALGQYTAHVELRTFIAHGEPQGRGLSCVVENRATHDITVQVGYDGTRNRIASRDTRHAIELRPAQAPAMRRVTLKPGASETVFTLSLDAIFFLDANPEHANWRWGWSRPAPRGAPPMSPLHGQYSLGWEMRRTESAKIAAEIEVDGKSVASQPLEIHEAKPRTEAVKALTRFESARVLLPDTGRRRYEITFNVLMPYEGTLTRAEHTLTLPSNTAEHLLSAAGARLNASGNAYQFAGTTMALEFARILPEPFRPGRLVLMRYERIPKSSTP